MLWEAPVLGFARQHSGTPAACLTATNTHAAGKQPLLLPAGGFPPFCVLSWCFPQRKRRSPGNSYNPPSNQRGLILDNGRLRSRNWQHFSDSDWALNKRVFYPTIDIILTLILYIPLFGVMRLHPQTNFLKRANPKPTLSLLLVPLHSVCFHPSAAACSLQRFAKWCWAIAEDRSGGDPEKKSGAFSS